VEEGHLLGEGGVVFAFEGLQQQRELGGFDGLPVDVDAVDVGGEDAFAFGDGETGFAFGVLIKALACLGEGLA